MIVIRAFDVRQRMDATEDRARKYAEVHGSARLRKVWFVRLTDLTLSCAAKAHVPDPKRRAGCRD